MPTQADVNRFLDLNQFMAPGRLLHLRFDDLLWRFPLATKLQFNHWFYFEMSQPAPTIQTEFAPAYRLCNHCNELLDTSKMHCANCGQQWVEF
jgi:hypothetical protein